MSLSLSLSLSIHRALFLSLPLTLSLTFPSATLTTLPSQPYMLTEAPEKQTLLVESIKPHESNLHATKKRRIITRCLVCASFLFVVVVTVSLLALKKGGGSKGDPDVPFVSATPDAALQRFFSLPQREWLGGDSVSSFPLGPNETTSQRMWLFGDTFIGTFQDGHRVDPAGFTHQSIGIQNHTGDVGSWAWGDIEYKWAVYNESGDPAPIVKPSHADGYYWFLQGLWTGEGSSALLICTRVINVDGFFQVESTSIVTVEDVVTSHPNDWEYRDTDLPHQQFDRNVSWTAGIVRDPHDSSMMYILGYKYWGLASFVLAKAPIRDWVNFNFTTTRFLSTDGEWRANATDLKPLFGKGYAGTESSLVFIEDKWYSVTLPVASTHLALYTSTDITGPWRRIDVYEVPLLPHTHAYAPKLHPQFYPGEALVITYILNTNVPSLYYEKVGAEVYVPITLNVSLNALQNALPL